MKLSQTNRGGVEARALGESAGGQLVDHHVGGIAADLPVFQGLVHIMLVDDAAGRLPAAARSARPHGSAFSVHPALETNSSF